MSVRARNEAHEGGGLGPPVWALGVCADGAARAEVCGRRGLVSLVRPSPPRAFSAGASRMLGIRAAWARPADTGDGSAAYPLIGYELELGEGAALANAQLVAAGDADLQAETSAALRLGVEYGVRLRARNDAGASNWTAVVMAMALYAPSAPRGVALEVTPERLTVAFLVPLETGLGDSTRAVTRYVAFAASPCLVAPRNVSVGGGRFNISLDGLGKGCAYEVRVRAENEAGAGEWSAPVSATVYGRAAAPEGLAVVPGTAQQLRISWGVPGDTGDGTANAALVEHYLVEVGPDTQLEAAALLHSIETQSLEVVIDDLAPGVEVFCRVRVVNRVGLGDAALGRGTPIIPALSTAAVALGSAVAGDTGAVTVSLTTNTSLVSGDLIAVVFPAGFDAGSATVGSTSLNGGALSREVGLQSACGYQCVSATPVVHLSLSLTAPLASGEAVTVLVQGIVNRGWSGPSGTFQIKTLRAAGDFTIDENLDVAGTDLVPGSLPGVSVTLEDARTGRDTLATVTFGTSTRNALPADAVIRLAFPSELALDGPQATVVGSSLLDGVLAVTLGAGEVTLSRSTGSAVGRSQAPLSLSLTGVRTPTFESVTGSISLAVMTSSGAVIDEATVPGLMIAAGNLTDTRVDAPTPLHAFSTESLSIVFRCGPVGLPMRSSILVTFPDNLDISQASVQSGAEGLSGIVQGSVEGQQLKFKRVLANYDAPAETLVTVVVDGVKSLYAGHTGVYTIRTVSTADGRLMEHHLSVDGSEIIPAEMVVSSLVLGSPVAGADTTLELEATLGGVLNYQGRDGGRILVEMPEGFELAVGLSHALDFLTPFTSATFSVSSRPPSGANCSELWLRCQVAARLDFVSGEELGGGEAFRLTLQLVRARPFAGATGAFNISLLSAAGRLAARGASGGLVLAPNALGSLRVEPRVIVTRRGGLAAQLNLSFAAANVVPPDVDFEITLPPGFSPDPTEALAVRATPPRRALLRAPLRVPAPA